MDDKNQGHRKDTHAMNKGRHGELDSRIVETHEKVTKLHGQRERLKAAVLFILDDADKLIASGDTKTAADHLAAFRANLDPHWLDMVLDAK